MFAGLLTALLLAAPQAEPPGSGRPEPPIRFLTFNIRYGTAADGPDSWASRRELVVRTLLEDRADVAGLQEALDFQLEYLLEELPRYRASGTFRDVGADGQPAGEWTGLLYDRERFRLVEEGGFWLSETPARPASKGWDAALPRVCAWVVLEEKATRGRFAVLGTHLDHRGAQSRLRASSLLVERARALAPMPTVVLGDFNAAEGSPPLKALAEAGFRDSFRVLHAAAEAVGTFHGFRGGSEGDKIDYVLVDGRWQVHEAGILRENWEGRYPSDHYPVFAVLTREPGRADAVPGIRPVPR